MGAFQLTSNPFALLRLSARDGRDAIVAAYDEALADGLAGEHDLLLAQQCLTASKPRLQAEVSWLCDVAPSRAATIVEGLRREPVPGEAGAWLEALTGLARANLAAHLCGQGTERSRFIDDLVAAHGEIEADSVADSVNAARALAGFPKVDAALVSEAVAALHEEHRAAALDAVFTASHPGLRMTEIVESFRDQGDLIRDFVDELVEGFDRRCSERFRTLEDSLRAAEARLREDPTSEVSAGEIAELLAEWDEYSQPRQLVFQAKGLDEPRSRQLYDPLRALCLWLANEQNSYAPARTIVRALQDTFPELPSVVAQISEDLTTLEDLVAEQGAAEVLAPLLAVIQEVRENPTRLAGAALRQLGPSGTGLGGRLYASFEESVAASHAADYQAMPWLALRSLAIDLNNEHDLPRVSLALLEMLQAKRAAKPPDTLAAKLAEDLRTVRENLLAADMSSSLKAGDLNRSLQLAQSLASEVSSPETRAQMAATRDAIQRQISSRRWKWFGWGAFGLFILWAIAQDEGTPRSGSPANPSATPSVVVASPARDLGGEVRPPAGQEHTHTRGEIRYCLFQEQRLEGMRPLTLADADVGRFNQLVADWNSRCSSYRYYEQDLSAVRAEALIKRTELRQQALSMLPSFAAPGRTEAVHPPGSVRSGNVLLSPYVPSDARLIQQRLRETGHYLMAPDGDWGRGSQDALESFKRGEGLPGNDLWDVDTQRRLFAGTQY